MSARADPANELAILLAEVADPYERAVQALRDVRHLLPPEGVATARYGQWPAAAAANRSDITSTSASQAWFKHGTRNPLSNDLSSEKCVYRTLL
jgi:hypothetical protein